MNAYMAWGQRDSPNRNATELVRGLADTWAFIESRLRAWTSAVVRKPFPMNGKVKFSRYHAVGLSTTSWNTICIMVVKFR